MTKIVPIESIVSKIIFLRGEKVLLDRDLAGLYRVARRFRDVRKKVNNSTQRALIHFCDGINRATDTTLIQSKLD